MLSAINISCVEAETITRLPENTVMISINNEHEELHRLKLDRSKTNEILTLQFSDITSKQFDSFDGKSYNPLSVEQALKILDFININKDKNFIIHCSAGISRSSAVALYLNVFHGHELKPSFWKLCHPNRYVMGQLVVTRNNKQI